MKNRSHQLVKDFFGAGAETTSTTLGWVLYFMLKYPDVQRKIRVILFLQKKLQTFTKSNTENCRIIIFHADFAKISSFILHFYTLSRMRSTITSEKV